MIPVGREVGPCGLRFLGAPSNGPCGRVVQGPVWWAVQAKIARRLLRPWLLLLGKRVALCVQLSTFGAVAGSEKLGTDGMVACMQRAKSRDGWLSEQLQQQRQMKFTRQQLAKPYVPFHGDLLSASKPQASDGLGTL